MVQGRNGMLCLCVLLLGSVLWQAAYGQDDIPAQDQEQNGRIQLTFPDDVELKTVVDYVAARLGINILYDDTVAKQRVTIRSPLPVDSEQLLPLLRSALQFRGLALVDAEQAGWLTVVPADKIARSSDWLDPHELPPDDAHRVLTRVIRFQHTVADPFVELAQGLLSKPGGNLLVLPDPRTIVVTDYAHVIETLLRLQELIDTPEAERSWRVHRVEHASPADVATTLQSLLVETGVSSAQPEGKKGVDRAVSIVPLPALKAILIAGTARQMDQAETLLPVLDHAVTMRTHVYRLDHTDSARAASILQQMARPLQAASGDAGGWIITPDPQANALVVTCPEPGHQRVVEWLERVIDLPSDASPTGVATRVFTVRFARAPELAQTLQAVFAAGVDADALKLEWDREADQTLPNSPRRVNDATNQSSDIGGPETADQTPSAPEPTPSSPVPAPSLFAADADEQDLVRLTVDEPTNSIICTGPVAMLGQVEQLIERLDHHRPQVLIDVAIVSISRSNAIDLGVEVAYLDSDNGQLSEALLTSFGLFDIDAEAGTATATVGPGLNAVLLRSDEVSVIVRALQTRLNGQVLARPRLLVADNETGTLNSINEQPFTSINAGETVSTTSFGGYAEAGTQVTLTPHISESDVVHLEYAIVSSSFTGSSTDENIPPPRATDSVSSRVTVPNGYTLLVGGLTRKNLQESRRQVPLIGDVPLLGEFFKSRNDTESETILYVFLKPVIHREDRFAYLRHVSERSLAAADLEHDAPPLRMEMLP